MTEITMLITTLPVSCNNSGCDAENEQSDDLVCKIPKILVEENLAACVNISAPVKSVYLWEGKLHNSAEAILMIKTTKSKMQELESRLKELHPYKVFELIEIPVQYCNRMYLDWVLQCCSDEKKTDKQ